MRREEETENLTGKKIKATCKAAELARCIFIFISIKKKGKISNHLIMKEGFPSGSEGYMAWLTFGFLVVYIPLFVGFHYGSH